MQTEASEGEYKPLRSFPSWSPRGQGETSTSSEILSCNFHSGIAEGIPSTGKHEDPSGAAWMWRLLGIPG